VRAWRHRGDAAARGISEKKIHFAGNEMADTLTANLNGVW